MGVDFVNAIINTISMGNRIIYRHYWKRKYQKRKTGIKDFYVIYSDIISTNYLQNNSEFIINLLTSLLYNQRWLNRINYKKMNLRSKCL